MKIRKNIVLEGYNNHSFLMDLHLASEAKDLVIFCHGFKGFKDWGAWHQVGEFFSSNAYHFIKFNFSHNGTTLDNQMDFDDLDAFEKNTYSIELNDLNSVLNWLRNEKSIGNISYNKVHLIGHSRGGPIAIIGGLNNMDVSSVTTWAGVPNLDYAFRKDFMEDWKENGVRYIFNGRTNQQMPLGYGLVEDYYKNEDKLDLVQVSKNAINHPKLHFIHGDNDRAIPYQATDILKSIFHKSKATIIPNTGHTFRSTHPWDQMQLPASLLLVCQFTMRNL